MNKYKLAEYLHKKFCSSNHIDGCDWYYFSNNCIGEGNSQKRYIKEAEELINFIKNNKEEK